MGDTDQVVTDIKVSVDYVEESILEVQGEIVNTPYDQVDEQKLAEIRFFQKLAMDQFNKTMTITLVALKRAQIDGSPQKYIDELENQVTRLKDILNKSENILADGIKKIDKDLENLKKLKMRSNTEEL